MTVRELRKLLLKFDQNLEVICTRCSDYCHVDAEEINVVRAVERVSGQHGWLMRSDATMSADDKLREKSYLHFEGN